MKGRLIRILHLYSHDMNIYGDRGNILCLKKRLEWYGYKPVVIEYNQGDKFPRDIDIIVGGGGQDSGQNKIRADLLKIGPKLKKLADGGTPMLVICGLYQLFGHFFDTADNEKIEGIGLLNIKTYGKSERLIGNIVTQSEKFGDIVGYENHSGQTFLGYRMEPLGKVRLGAGNNANDSHEGAIYKNVIGTYLHGSLLPKNPAIADFLIEKAIYCKYGERLKKSIKNKYINKYAELARESALKRPR